MSERRMVPAILTKDGLGALLQTREIAQRNVPAFDFRRVDRMLARFRLVLELAWDDSVGPRIEDGLLVVLQPGEYQDMADVAFHAKLYAIAGQDFPFHFFVGQINRLAVAAGFGRYQIPTRP
jgi:hypothetical protein